MKPHSFALVLLTLLAGCASPPLDPQAEWDAGAGRCPVADTLFSMARIYIAQGQDDQAEAALREVVDKDPDFVRAYEELAHLYVRRDLVDGAVAALQVGLLRQADDPVLLNDLGVCKLLQKDPAAAAEAFIRAAALQPDNARPRANLALALALQGRDDEALALWKQVIRPDEARQNLELVKKAR
jgi:Flp pilus assembly protein TadD